MPHTRRRLLATAAVGSVGLAGCIGGDDGTGDGNGGGATATPTSMDGSPATVRVRSHASLADILVDAEGMTLYMFDNDEQGAGASTCTGGCADAWPPLTVDGDPTAGDDVSATLSTFERGDGSTQVAAAGWPLYYFASDSEPGDAKGQGSNGVWWVLSPDGTPMRESATATPTDGGGGGVY